MKKRTTIILVILVLFIVGGIAVGSYIYRHEELRQMFMSKEQKQQEREKKDLAYLQEHEQEIANFIQSQNSKVESVQINWSYTYWDKSGRRPSVILYGRFNHNEKSAWGVRVPYHQIDDQLDMASMELVDKLRIGAEYVE